MPDTGLVHEALRAVQDGVETNGPLGPDILARHIGADMAMAVGHRFRQAGCSRESPPMSSATSPAAPADPARITAWHAHVYYDPATTRAVAARLREHLAAAFPEAVLGRWHDQPVGPHPAAMYQVLFGPALFPRLVPFLALNREGLTVLVHPETGRARADHLHHALWLGAVLPLKAEVLPE